MTITQAELDARLADLDQFISLLGSEAGSDEDEEDAGQVLPLLLHCDWCSSVGPVAHWWDDDSAAVHSTRLRQPAHPVISYPPRYPTSWVGTQGGKYLL